MLGAKGGAVKIFSDLIGITDVPAFHCVAHRLELTVHAAAKSVTQCNNFSIFLDKLSSTFTHSAKKLRLLENVALSLGCILKKVGKVFDVR